MFPTSGPHNLLGLVPPQYWESPLGVFVLFVFIYLMALLPFMFVIVVACFFQVSQPHPRTLAPGEEGPELSFSQKHLRDWNAVSGQLSADFIIS